MIQPCYYKGERGNNPYPLETMLRLYLLQSLYDLSDEATVAEAIDSRAFSEFCGVDRDSGLVYTVEATAANVHDVSETSKLLAGEEDVVCGGSGYLGADKQEDAMIRNKSGHKSKYEINRRPSQVKKLSKSGQYAAKKVEHAKSSVRAKAEHVFDVVKKQLHF